MSDRQIEEIGEGARQLIDRGRKITVGKYYAAQQVAHRESASILRFWDEYHVLITPTVPWLPPLTDGFPATEEYVTKWSQYALWETFTSPANVTGQPAVSLPCRSVSQTGVPIGIHLMGRYGNEAELFTLAAAYERAAPWGDRRPNIARFSNRATVHSQGPE